MSLPQVCVKNEYENTIWVRIDENQKHPIETKSETIGETDFETYYQMIVDGKVAVPIKGLPIEVGGKVQNESKEKLRTYWKDNKEGKYTWTGFLDAGEEPVPSGRSLNWARKNDEPRYFLSIRSTRAGAPMTVADSLSRQDAVITIDGTGHINDEVAPVAPSKAVTGKVYLQKAGAPGSFIGDPETDNSNWDCGTIGSAAGLHQLQAVGGALQTGAAVRIVSSSTNLQSATYKYMYSSEAGNVFYDVKQASGRDSDKQQWIVSKTTAKANSDGNELHFGDQVRISSRFWKNANLGVNGKWLQCVADDSTLWILKETPK